MSRLTIAQVLYKEAQLIVQMGFQIDSWYTATRDAAILGINVSWVKAVADLQHTYRDVHYPHSSFAIRFQRLFGTSTSDWSYEKMTTHMKLVLIAIKGKKPSFVEKAFLKVA